MWLFAMFDVPVETREQQRAYRHLRNELIRRGFTMLQYSVYCRYCPSEDSADTYKKYIKQVLPAEGQVRLLMVTDRQFGKMEVYFGKNRKPVEDPPAQTLLF